MDTQVERVTSERSKDTVRKSVKCVKNVDNL